MFSPPGRLDSRILASLFSTLYGMVLCWREGAADAVWSVAGLGAGDWGSSGTHSDPLSPVLARGEGDRYQYGFGPGIDNQLIGFGLFVRLKFSRRCD